MSETERLVKQEDLQSVRRFDRFVRPIIAECVGVCLFVFVGVLSLESGNIVAAALGHGFTIALLIMGLGEISGGHFNPAVTLGAALSAPIHPLLAIGYFIGQILGAMLGAALTRAVLPSTVYSAIKGGTHQLGLGTEPGWAVLIEMMLTTVLVFTVLLSAINQQTKSKLAPLAIGFAVAVDIMAGGILTGASMNPARAIGPAIAASAVVSGAWNYHYVYWVGPTLGSLLAALLYRFFFAAPGKRWISRAV